MIDYDIPYQELAQLRAKWGLPDVPKQEAAALAKVQKELPPAKVLVRKERQWGNLGPYFRFFFIAIDADGSRRLPFNTTHAGIAKSEARRYQKMGVPLEVMKEVEFE
jgi:hypothetical protein